MLDHWVGLLWVIVLAWTGLKHISLQPRVDIPTHMLQHHAVEVPDLLSEEEANNLVQRMKNIGTLTSNTADTLYYEVKHEHIGEAVPMVDGTCDHHAFLLPDKNRTNCILPGRVDIGRHFITYGGLGGLKEFHSKGVSRLLTFGVYLFLDQIKEEKFPEMFKLFESDKFSSAAKSVCPTDQSYFEPGQVNFIVQVPGQAVPLHIDGVYFWGASRYQFPQWLLAAMKFSGLYEKEFIHQVQVVGYLHNWTDAREGQFVYWRGADKMRETVRPLPRLGTVVDGSKTVHAATTYLPDADFPTISKDKNSTLKYLGNEEWQLQQEDTPLRKYATSDLRITIVYRGKCWESKEKAQEYKDLNEEDHMSLDDVLSTLASELVKRGKLAEEDLPAFLGNTPSQRLDLAIKFLDEFIKYPLPEESVFFPLNYCALAKLYPWTHTLLHPFC